MEPITTCYGIAIILLVGFLIAWGLNYLQNLVFRRWAGKSTTTTNQYCSHCGRRLDPDENFCPGCGRQVQQNQPTAEPEPIPAPAAPRPKTRRNAWIILIGLALLLYGAYATLQNLGLTNALQGAIQDSLGTVPPARLFSITGQTTTVARSRYALADLQLGGAKVEDDYRKYASDPEIRDILTSWDQGERVINIYQFERFRQSDGIWVLVYTGTSRPISGGDVLLSVDIGALGNHEAQIRYILAEAQLGGLIEFYRRYISDPVIAEAVRRWDAGVRIANIGDYDWIIYGSNGRRLVYRGTDQTINAAEIIQTDQAAAPTQPPTSASCQTDEGRIAYIIADIQLGGVDNYYRSLTSDPVIAEAVRRWDAGVRVANIQNFERQIVGNEGWKVTYAGTTQIAGCNDIQLTAETASTGEWGVCNNPYFPSIAGAYWDMQSEYEPDVRRYSVVDARSDGYGNGVFTVVGTTVGTDLKWYEKTFACAPDGVIRDLKTNRIYIPPPTEMTYEHDFYDALSGETIHIGAPGAYETPAGTFDNCVSTSYLSVIAGGEVYCYGIGIIRRDFDTSSLVLIQYYLP